MEIPSIERAMQVLKSYDQELTRAKSELLSGINYDGMPKGTPKGNPSTNAVTTRIDAQQFIKVVDTVLDFISENHSDYVTYLTDIYIKGMTQVDTAIDMNIGRRTLIRNYRETGIAELRFAEMVPDEIVEIAEHLSNKSTVKSWHNNGTKLAQNWHTHGIKKCNNMYIETIMVRTTT